jgi:hypothetical protein
MFVTAHKLVTTFSPDKGRQRGFYKVYQNPLNPPCQGETRKAFSIHTGLQVFLLSIILFVASFSHASAADITTYLLNFYTPSNISGWDKSLVAQLGTLPGISTTSYNISGLNRNQTINAGTSYLLNAPEGIKLFEFSGHGDPRGYYATTGNTTMYDQVRMATEAAQAAGTQVISIIDCCGSGNLANFAQNPSALFGDGLNNLAAITSSAPGKVSFVGDGKSVAERLAYYRNNVGKLDANGKPLYDTNGDGILTVGELRDAMAKDGKGNQFIIPPGNEGAPVFASDKEKLEAYKKNWLGVCIVVKPGQDKAFGKMYGVPGVKGIDTDADVNGDPFAPDFEDELNFKLRKANFGCLSSSPVKGTTDAGTMPGCDPNKKDGSNYDVAEQAVKDAKSISWVSGEKYKSLSKSQAEEALKSDVHAYTVPENKLVRPYPYTKGSTAKDAKGEPIYVVRENCKFITPQSPSPIPIPPPDNNRNNNPPNGGQGGGQQPQQGGSGQQNPSPTPTANPNSTPTPTPIPGIACSQEYSPICDENLQTQPNECIAIQKGAKVLRDGACTADAKTTTSLSAAIGNLITQSLASGIPENTIANTIKTIISLVRGVYDGSSSLLTSVLQQ